jgi:hypothetical protein
MASRPSARIASIAGPPTSLTLTLHDSRARREIPLRVPQAPDEVDLPVVVVLVRDHVAQLRRHVAFGLGWIWHAVEVVERETAQLLQRVCVQRDEVGPDVVEAKRNRALLLQELVSDYSPFKSR